VTRIEVRKTYKLFIGGEFPRSESGHSYVVNDARGRFVANAALASRKDARDAVSAARKAFPGWSGRTAYNRAQILYRVAEVMEDRRPQFVDAVRQGEGRTAAAAGKVVDAAIDRLVWYAGWADKITQVVGNANPVAGPFFNLSTPEPTGVVAVVAPAESSLLGLVSVLAPVVVTGNTALVAASPDRPLPAVTFAEVLATSDVPAGVVNILTGALANTVPTLASHMDVNAIDLTGLAGDAEQATAAEVAAADNLKRVRRAPAAEPDWNDEPGIDRMTAFLETKTVWHPIGV
jgi:acyl-CoA reductase-like NAD-dependent aldehyde dehydrogenase